MNKNKDEKLRESTKIRTKKCMVEGEGLKEA